VLASIISLAGVNHSAWRRQSFPPISRPESRQKPFLAKTTALVLENDRSGFGKRPQSFLEMTAVVSNFPSLRFWGRVRNGVGRSLVSEGKIEGMGRGGAGDFGLQMSAAWAANGGWRRPKIGVRSANDGKLRWHLCGKCLLTGQKRRENC